MTMADLEQELNNTVDGVQAQADEQTSETTAENSQEQEPQTLSDVLNGGEEPKSVTVQEELWKKTKNYEKGLWKTPDDVYKSVQFYEQKYQPLEQTLKRMGFDEPAQLEQAFKDYQAKMPVYQENENLINQLNALLQNDVYGSKLRSVFDEIRRAQETEKFGMAFDDLPPVIKERVLKGEQAFQQLEEMKQEQAYNNALGTIQDQMAQIEQIATENGIDDFDKKAFLEYCRDNNISPSNMKGEFLNAYYGKMLEIAKQNASLATSAQNKQNKVKALNSSTKQAGVQQSQIPKMNNIDDLEKTLLNQLE
jgi:tellurite resistance protein